MHACVRVCVCVSRVRVCVSRGKDDKYRPRRRFTDDDDELLPKAVEGVRGKHVVDVCLSPSHMMVLTKSGLLYSCGANEHGQLGHHRDRCSAPVVTKPSRVNSPIVAGRCHVAMHCGPLQVSGLIDCCYLSPVHTNTRTLQVSRIIFKSRPH